MILETSIEILPKGADSVTLRTVVGLDPAKIISRFKAIRRLGIFTRLTALAITFLLSVAI